MQRAAKDIDLPDEPTLVLIEDETGSGKTEAALILAQRMMQAGKGHGLFFALPTMATANAMFDRAADLVSRMFETPPSLALAHGRARLSRRFRDLVRAERSQAMPACIMNRPPACPRCWDCHRTPWKQRQKRVRTHMGACTCARYQLA